MELGTKAITIAVLVEGNASEAHRDALPRGIILSLIPDARRRLALHEAERGLIPSW